MLNMTTSRSKVEIDPFIDDTFSRPLNLVVSQKFYDKKYLQEAGSSRLYLKSISYSI